MIVRTVTFVSNSVFKKTDVLALTYLGEVPLYGRRWHMSKNVSLTSAMSFNSYRSSHTQKHLDSNSRDFA